MELKGIDEEKLAKLFSERAELYNSFSDSLSSLKGSGVLSPELEKILPKLIETVERANNTARNSDYYVFRVFDSWADKTGGHRGGSGYNVYQRHKENLVEVLGLTSDGPYHIDETLKFLKKRKVSKVFTIEIIGEYYGIKSTRDDSDGDYVDTKALLNEDIDEFKKSGIEAVLLNQR